MDQDDHNEIPLWRVARDDQGNAVLAWTPGSHRDDPASITPTDELSQTYSHLRRLDVSALTIEGESPLGDDDGFDPYNTGAWQRRPLRKIQRR